MFLNKGIIVYIKVYFSAKWSICSNVLKLDTQRFFLSHVSIYIFILLRMYSDFMS